MSPWKPSIAALAILGLPAACRAPPPAAEAKAPARAPAADSAYVSPPVVVQARQSGTVITLEGGAEPGARVRLATPQGEARFAAADERGRWSLALPVAAEPRILGVSAVAAGRQAQSQGYLLLTPRGQAALLRAGSGALRLDAQPATSIGALDFDSEGGAVVSGAAPAGQAVILKLDGRQAAEGRADAVGRYSIALPSSVEAGPHRLEIAGDGFAAQAAVTVAPAAPLGGQPFRSQMTSTGVRADWMTPGGGLQSTLILGDAP